ncbi:MAG: hypothetical protein ACRD0P_37410, partial [Stackebrandtia sp.]
RLESTPEARRAAWDERTVDDDQRLSPGRIRIEWRCASRWERLLDLLSQSREYVGRHRPADLTCAELETMAVAA